MSYIFNQLVKSRIEQFNNCKPEGLGKWDILPGQVIIKELHPTPIGITGETMFCYANWRPSVKSAFYKGQTFRMNTDVLYSKASFSTKKDVPVQELVGKYVDVQGAAISHYVNNKGKAVTKYRVNWGIINKDPETETVSPRTAGIYALVNTGTTKAKTLGEAIESFYAQSDESVEVSSYYEGYPEDTEWDWHQPQEDEYFDKNDTNSID